MSGIKEVEQKGCGGRKLAEQKSRTFLYCHLHLRVTTILYFTHFCSALFCSVLSCSSFLFYPFIFYSLLFCIFVLPILFYFFYSAHFCSNVFVLLVYGCWLTIICSGDSRNTTTTVSARYQNI